MVRAAAGGGGAGAPGGGCGSGSGSGGEVAAAGAIWTDAAIVLELGGDICRRVSAARLGGVQPAVGCCLAGCLGGIASVVGAL